VGCIVGLVIVAAVAKKFVFNRPPAVALQQVLVQLPQPPPPIDNAPEMLRPIRRQDNLHEGNMADFIGDRDIEARKFVNSQWPASLGSIVHVELNPGLDTRQFALLKFQNAWNAQPLNREIRFEYVWHGTKAQNVRDISFHGFDPARRGETGQAYGVGEYFGLNATISHGYCKPDGDGLNRMIVAMALRVPQTTFHNNNTIMVVNNPTSSLMSYVLPVLIVTYGRPRQNYVFRSAFENGGACDRVLYHRTTSEAARSIKQDGFDANRSKGGLVGKGFYFATHPRSTFQKTKHHDGLAAHHQGSLLRVTVSVGCSCHVPPNGDQGINHNYLASHAPPLSSVRIPRYDWNGQQSENGAEYVVYNVSQVKRIELVSETQYAEIPNLP
jgi:hypothetical protein